VVITWTVCGLVATWIVCGFASTCGKKIKKALELDAFTANLKTQQTVMQQPQQPQQQQQQRAPPLRDPRFLCFPPDYPCPSLLPTLADVWRRHDPRGITFFRGRMLVESKRLDFYDQKTVAEIRVNQLVAPHALKYMRVSRWTLGGTTLEFMQIAAFIVATPASEDLAHYPFPSFAVSDIIKTNFKIGVGYPFVSWKVADGPMEAPDEDALEIDVESAGEQLTTAEAIKLNEIRPHIPLRCWAEMTAEGNSCLRAVVADSYQDPDRASCIVP
jgi:hypothetical protein